MSIRQLRREDAPALRAFAKGVWPRGRPDVLEARWWFQTDPARAYAELDEEGRIQAICGAWPHDVQVEGKPVPAIGFSDWFVSPAARGMGAGRRVAAAAMQGRPGFAISISDHAARAFVSMGWRPAPPLVVPAFFRVLMGPRRSTRDAAGFFVAERSLTGGSTLEADAFDDLWRRASKGLGVAMVRDSRHLEAHIGAVPWRKHHLVTVHAGSELVAYALGRDLPGPGRISLLSDILHDPANEAALTVALERWLTGAAQRARWGVLTLSTTPSHKRALGAAGFLSSDRAGSGPRVRRLSTRAMDSLVGTGDPRDRHITPLDGDFDLAYRARHESPGVPAMEATG